MCGGFPHYEFVIQSNSAENWVSVSPHQVVGVAPDADPARMRRATFADPSSLFLSQDFLLEAPKAPKREGEQHATI